MAAFSSLWGLLPKSIRTVPADLVAVVAVVLATDLAVFAPVVRDTAVRIPLGLVFVLFVPGYAVIAALFPNRGDGYVSGTEMPDIVEVTENSLRSFPLDSPITAIERVILAFASSLAIVPVLGLVLHFAPVTIRLPSITISLSVTTVGAAAVAVRRRRSIPPGERFRVPYQRWIASARSGLSTADSRAETALTVLVATALVLAVGGVGYAAMVQPNGETFTEVAVLTESDDELAADTYPAAAEDDDRNLTVTLENNEQRPVNYTVVAVEQLVESDDDGNATVRDQNELRRFEAQLDHGETWSQRHDLEPTATDGTVRIAWLVYTDGSVPATPTLENADYSTHIWSDTSDE